MVMMMAFSVAVSANNNVNTNKPVIKVTNVSHAQLETNESYELTVSFTNVGSSYGEDGSFTLLVPEETPVTITDQILYQNVPYLNSNADYELTYNILVDSGAAEGFYKLGLEGTYYDDDNQQYSYEETFSVEIVEGEKDAILEAEVVNDASVVAGADSTVTINITNSGNGPAWAVTPVVVNTDEIFAVGESDQYLSTLDGGETYSFDFDISVDDDVSGFTPITLEVSYLTGNGEASTTISTYMDIKEEATGDLVIENVSKSKSTIYPDGKVTFDVTVGNVGSTDLEDVKIEVSQDPGLVPSSQSIIMLNNLDAGTSEVVSFIMQATDSASTQNYPVEFTVAYDGNTVSQYSGVNIINDEDDEDEEVTKPRIIISDFDISVDKIFLGDTFDMNFDVTNTSTIKDIRNLKVVLETSTGQTSESVFLPLNQSNSFFVSALGTGESSEINIPLKVFANAEGKSYSLEITFEYEDYDGEFYTDSETISVPVYEKTELTVSDVRVGTSLDTGYTLEVDFYNTGKVDITNMMVDLEGDFTATNSNYYVGDFTTGRTDVYDVEITGALPDSIEGTIIFTYDDTFGEEETYEKTFTIGGSSDTGARTGANAGAAAGGATADGGTAMAGGRGQTGAGGFGDMTEEQMTELRSMSNEERQAFMAGGGFEAEATSTGLVGNIMNNALLYGGIGILIIIGAAISVVIVRRRKRSE